MVEEKTAKMSSVLGETSVVIGNVDGSGDLEIRGRVQGSVNLSGRVLIAETGVVLGGVEATHISVSGEVRGDLTAKDGVEVQAQGQVEGNIEAPRVGIEAGARVRGMLRTGAELPIPQPQQTSPTPSPSKRPPKKARLRPKKSDRRERQLDQASAPERKESAGSRVEGSDHRSDIPGERPEPPPPAKGSEKRIHKKGPPAPPTFVKGARGRTK